MLSTNMTFQDQGNTTTFNLAFCRFLATKFVYGPRFWSWFESVSMFWKFRKLISPSNVFSIISSFLNISGLLGRGIISLFFVPLPSIGVFCWAWTQQKLNIFSFLMLQTWFKISLCIEVLFTVIETEVKQYSRYA